MEQMKVLVAVLSFNRPYDIMKRTGRWLPKLFVDWKIFIEPQQLRYYEQNFTQEQLETTATDIGVAGQMRHVAEYAKRHGYTHVFKVDDDMNFKKSGSKATDSNLIVEEFISECEQLQNEIGSIGAFTISKPIEYLHRNGIKWKRRNKTLFGNYLVKTELLQLPAGLKLSDDMVVGVVVQQAGLPMYTYQFAHEDAIAWTNKGGCQSFDRFKTTDADMQILREHFPLIRQTENKGRADIYVGDYF